MFELRPYSHQNHFEMDPFRACEQLERKFFGDDFAMPFGNFSGIKTDIKDNGSSFELEAELPGFDKKDISIDLDGDTLTIRAKHEDKKDEKDKSYIRRERSYGEYSRSFDISGVEADKITAKYDNGVLRLEMPKRDEQQPKGRKLIIE